MDADLPELPGSIWQPADYDRTRSVGASDMPVILGLSPWRGPVDLWREKCTRSAVVRDTSLLVWGRMAESAIATFTVQALGCVALVCPPCRSRERPHAHASLDRLIAATLDLNGTLPRGLGVLECKLSTEHWTAVPRNYLVQVQHQLYVTGLEWGLIAATLHGRPPEFWWVNRDQRWIDGVMLPALDAFWKHVEDVVPPEPTEHDTGSPGAPTRTRTRLPAGAALWVRDILAHEQRIELHQAEVDRLKNKLRLALTDAAEGVLPTGDLVLYRPNKHGSRTLLLPRTKS